MNLSDTIATFRSAMREIGIAPPEQIQPDGMLHRFHVEGDRAGSLNGWYVLHVDGRPAGGFGSWKSGARTTWSAGGDRQNDADRDRATRLVEAARAKARADRRAAHEQRAEQARHEWDLSGAPDPSHPYLVAKGVSPHGLRQLGAWLIVPLVDIYGMLWNVQRIMPDGAKRFRPGRAGGLFSPIGDLASPTRLLICEGWGTGSTLHDETGAPVLCAMNAGNLLPVASAARAAWPSAALVICADNDRFTPGNPGVAAATAAARAAGARLIVPEFPADAIGTDFNDLAALRRKERAA